MFGTRVTSAAARPTPAPPGPAQTGDRRRPSPAAAAVLSIVAPGVGQLYAGVPARGALVWIATQIVGGLALAAVTHWPGRLGFSLYVIGMAGALFGAAVDAGRAARRGAFDPDRHRFDHPVAIVVACGAVIIATSAWGILIGSRIAERLRVPTETMVPTLLAGDRVFVAPRRTEPVTRGEIVVYRRWETRYAKRVLGVPGDTLAMQGGALRINGRLLTETYAIHAGEDEITDRRFAWQRSHLTTPDSSRYRPTLATWGPLVTPPGSYFVLGDDRGQSVDSRYDGFLPDTAIIGWPVTIYFSRDPVALRVRWDRIGKAVPGRN
jgi:signal peptidase I